MATESIGRTVYADNDMADRIIAAIEYEDAHPSKPAELKTKWADDEFMNKLHEELRREYPDAFHN
ncbi:MAG: hypothetical protein LBG97_07735 [Coriobacteriales bacterium]|nr:hypothetical protein [Coriobacteriales bacterium]